MKTPEYCVALLGCMAIIVMTTLSANAEIVLYNEFNGSHLPALTGNGNLTGSGQAHTGMNISDIPDELWRGVEDNAFHILESNTSGALVEHYFPYAVNGTAYCCQPSNATLTGGPQNGAPINNVNYLGATNGRMVYLDADNSISEYSELGDTVVAADYLWTTFSGGDLDGATPGAVNGLRHVGGGVAISENYWASVEADGTLEYHLLTTGAHSAGLEATYGSWTTLASGPLAGLTLTSLDARATGFANGFKYRFLGIGNDYMFFDVVAVPEPSAALLLVSGLASFACARRRRAAWYSSFF